MLVNVCDLEPVLGSAPLYWTSWSGSSDPFIFSPNAARRMPSGTGPIFGNSLHQVDKLFSRRKKPCIWGYTLYINTFSYAADVKFKLFWLNKGISDTCIKKCIPVFFKFTDKMSNAYLNTPAPSISYWIH